MFSFNYLHKSLSFIAVDVRVGVCVCSVASYAYSYNIPAPPLANDRCNKTSVKDGTIHHIVEGTRNQA